MEASLDQYITGGRYRQTMVDVECKNCGKIYEWKVCYEYCASWYQPEEVICPYCGTEEEDDNA